VEKQKEKPGQEKLGTVESRKALKGEGMGYQSPV